MHFNLYNRGIRQQVAHAVDSALKKLSLQCSHLLVILLEEMFKYEKLLSPETINYLQGKGRSGSSFNLPIKHQRKLHHTQMGDRCGWPGRQRDQCVGINGIASTDPDRQTLALEKRAKANVRIQLPLGCLRVLTHFFYLVTNSRVKCIKSLALTHRGEWTLPLSHISNVILKQHGKLIILFWQV